MRADMKRGLDLACMSQLRWPGSGTYGQGRRERKKPHVTVGALGGRTRRQAIAFGEHFLKEGKALYETWEEIGT